jgi:hypothetical protein
MYSFGSEMIISGDVAQVWRTWTDMPAFPAWDPREEETRLDGPFEVGTHGWSKQRGNPGGPFTLAAIEPGRAWSSVSPLPGGKLVVGHFLEQLAGGKIRVGKRYDVYGPLTVLFRLYYRRTVTRSLPETFAALQVEAARRAAAYA